MAAKIYSDISTYLFAFSSVDRYAGVAPAILYGRSRLGAKLKTIKNDDSRLIIVKLIKVTILFIAISSIARSQEITRNNVFLEVGGASMFYSINYERLLFNNTERNLSVRFGQMFLILKNDGINRYMIGFPVGVSYLKRINKNFFEAGISVSTIYDTYDLAGINGEILDTVQDFIIMPSIRSGIRHQPYNNGFYWNALIQFSMVAFGDIDNFQPQYTAFPFISIGLGYSFR